MSATDRRHASIAITRCAMTAGAAAARSAQRD
jgi:hypothetical protein